MSSCLRSSESQLGAIFLPMRFSLLLSPNSSSRLFQNVHRPSRSLHKWASGVESKRITGVCSHLVSAALLHVCERCALPIISHKKPYPIHDRLSSPRRLPSTVQKPYLRSPGRPDLDEVFDRGPKRRAASFSRIALMANRRSARIDTSPFSSGGSTFQCRSLTSTPGEGLETRKVPRGVITNARRVLGLMCCDPVQFLDDSPLAIHISWSIVKCTLTKCAESSVQQHFESATYLRLPYQSSEDGPCRYSN